MSISLQLFYSLNTDSISTKKKKYDDANIQHNIKYVVDIILVQPSLISWTSGLV